MSLGMFNPFSGDSTATGVNVQSDWNETDNTSDAFIKNKPTSLPASDVSSWAKEPIKPTYTASEVGLGNVDNTSDLDKPVSTATQTALDTKASTTTLTTHTGDNNIHVTSAEKTKLNSIEAVGAIYKSTSNTNPSTIFDGTWTLVHSGYERQQIGTQVLYDEISGSENVGKTNLIGAYGYGLIDGLFSNISVPSGCHKEYRITFQGRTGGSNMITIYLNNIATSSIGTWSSETFRMIGSSQFFKESDITLEPTMGYVSPGCNLKYQVTGVSNSWNIRNISVSGFIVTDAQIYTWRRTA